MYKEKTTSLIKSAAAAVLAAAFILGSISGIKNSGLAGRSAAANLSALRTTTSSVLLADDWDIIDFF